MGTPFPQRSLAGGELAPALQSRVDLSKYQTGLKTCRNFTVSKSGGAKTRPGFRFIAECKDSDYLPRLVRFSPNESQSYILLFEDFNMRVIKDYDYIYDKTLYIESVTASGSASVLVGITSHGFSTGDEVWIEGVVGVEDMNNRQLKVTVVDANSFRLTKMDGSATTDITGTYSSGGLVYRVMDITGPFSTDDIGTVKYIQDGASAIFVHKDYKPQKLTYVSDTEWYFEELDLDDLIPAPTVTNNGGAGSTYSWVVTSIEKDTYEESVASTATTSADEPVTSDPIVLTITAVSGASEYAVYKRTNGVYGYIGTAEAVSGTITFSDNGITPDISKQPPIKRDLADVFEDFYELEDPATLPGDVVNCVAWSQDGNVLAVGSDDDTGETARRLFLYSRSGDTLTKLTNPSTMPTGVVNGLAWSFDGKFLAVAHDTTPFITVYSVSGTGASATFTKLTDPSDLPDGNATCCAFTPTGRGLFVGTGTSPYYHWYGFDGTTFTEYANVFTSGSIPGAQINSVAFSPSLYYDNQSTLCEMTIGLNDVGVSPYLTVYAKSFTVTPNPTSSNKAFSAYPDLSFSTGVVYDVEWSPNGEMLAIAHASSPYISVYEQTPFGDGGGSSTKLTNPSTLPTGTGRGVSWMADSGLLAVSHVTTPFLTNYHIYGSDSKKIVVADFPETTPPGNSYDVSINPNGLYLTVGSATADYFANYGIYLNNPSAITTYQQRLILGNTYEKPLGVWASRTGLPYNFTTSTPIRDDDSLSFSLFASRPASIVDMADVGRLILLTTSTEYSAKGGDDGVMRPGEINPRAHSYNGSSSISPEVIDNSLVYVHRSEKSLHDLVYDYETDGYRGNDLTVFSTHLFDGYTVERVSFQKTPDSILWVVRSDGTLLGMTYVKEHDIFAWHRHDTDGDVEDICVIPDGGQDAVYVIVKRTIDSVDVRYIERLEDRTIDDIVDYKQLDSVLTYDGRNAGTTTVTLSGGTNWDNDETITCTASAATFVSGDVGNEVRITLSGTEYRLTIEGYTSTSVVTVRPQRDIPAGIRNTATTAWSLAKDTITGLWHLEGAEVSVFADGFVEASVNNGGGLTVSNGDITLSRPRSVVHVGLPITSDIQTLDIDTANGETLMSRSKLFNSVTLRLQNTRGVHVGAEPPSDDDTDALENLDRLKMRQDEPMDDPTSLYTGIFETNAPGTFTDGGSVFIRQVDPLPAEILAICPEVEIGS